MHTEYEIVSFDRLRHFNIFLNNIIYRNYHSHSAFELLLVLSGNAEISLTNGSIDVSPGSLVILNPYEYHEIDARGNSIDTIIFQVSHHFCRDYVPSFQHIRFDCRDLNNALKDHSAHRLICEAALSFLRQEPFFEFTCIEKTARLFRTFLEQVPYTLLSDSDRASLSKKIQRMQRIAGYIEEHYTDPLRLSDIAELEALTETHVSHFFTENFGVSFQEYLNNLRFERASILMRDPALSMGKVALSCGFSDLKYLNQTIKRRTGLDQRTYRQKILGSDTSLPSRRNESLLEKAYTSRDAADLIGNYLQTL